MCAQNIICIYNIRADFFDFPVAHTRETTHTTHRTSCTVRVARVRSETSQSRERCVRARDASGADPMRMANVRRFARIAFDTVKLSNTKAEPHASAAA